MRHVTDNLAGYLERALPPDARERVERHLAVCAHCRAELATLRAAGPALIEAGRAAPVPAANGALWSRVHAEITPPPRRFAPRWAFAGSAVLAAAVFAVVMLARPDVTPSVPGAHPDMVARAPSPAETGRTARTEDTAGEGEKYPKFAPHERAAETRAPAPAAPSKRMDAPPAPALIQPPSVRPATPVPATASPSPRALDVPVASSPREPMDTDLTPEGITSVFAYHEDNALHATPPPPGGAEHAPAAKARAPGGAAPQGALKRALPAERPQGFGGGAPPAADALTSQRKAEEPSAGFGDALRIFARAESDHALGHAREAREGYDAALILGLPPTQARLAHMRLGDAAVKAKDDTAALREYTAALEIAETAGLRVHLGAVYERLGNYEKAESEYRRALTLSPANTKAKAGLDRLTKRDR